MEESRDLRVELDLWVDGEIEETIGFSITDEAEGEFDIDEFSIVEFKLWREWLGRMLGSRLVADIWIQVVIR